MRAISILPAWLRRSSTSLTLISNFAVGLYAVAAHALVTAPGRPKAASAVIILRTSRRPYVSISMLTSLQADRELSDCRPRRGIHGDALTRVRRRSVSGQHP